MVGDAKGWQKSVVSARVCGSHLVEIPTSQEFGSLGRERNIRGGER